MRNLFNRIKFLFKTKKILSLGLLILLLVSIPLFVFAVIKQNFDIRNRAATGEPTVSPEYPISCNYTVNPPRTCPEGYECITDSNLLGADGICKPIQNCIPKPDCIDGIPGPNGTTVYCAMAHPSIPFCTPTPKPSPAVITCNYTVNPPRTCPNGYKCISNSNLAGADGICKPVQTCIPKPPCIDGIPGPNGTILYCEMQHPTIPFCSPTPKPTPKPSTLPCVTEGNPQYSSAQACCAGLNLVSSFSITNGKCVASRFFPVCVRCGNGICGQGENFCNCPKDCPSTSPIPSPSPSPITIIIKVKFAGIENENADGANIKLRFKNSSVDYQTNPISVTHDGDGVYKAEIIVPGTLSGNGYIVYVKGEKHLSTKFCFPSDQSMRCLGYLGNIVIPSSGTLNLDFTKMALQPGDLPPQDGSVNSNDFIKVKTLLSKLSSDITTEDLNTADLNYDGKINIFDAFLLRTTLETKYDDD
jgi:hypothetical protein